MTDLSVLIAARNEIWLSRTVEDVLAHARANTEVIVVLDGAPADPPLPVDPCVVVISLPQSIGQRAAVNLAARASTATYVMKLDAHCSVDDGFDAKLIAADAELGRADVTQIPAMYNLHAFNWKCGACGVETYQGPTLTECTTCRAKGPFERVVYWDLKAQKAQNGRLLRTDGWRFDSELHFQYWGDYKRRPEAKGELIDVMTSIGACFFMRRARFWALSGMDEAHGSWGQFGTEVACKSWLSGGRHIVNKRTWFAHLFRTQGGDFSFPYHNPESGKQSARNYSQNMWFNNLWPGQILSLAWLIEKFAPIPGWHDTSDGKVRLDYVGVQGKLFTEARNDATRSHVVDERGAAEHDGAADRGAEPDQRVSEPGGDAHVGRRVAAGSHLPGGGPTVGAVYYSDLRGDPLILDACRRQIQRSVNGHHIVSVTLAPLDFGHERIVLPLERGRLTMFKQILAGLEALDTDVAFLVEHDVLYHPSHFQFAPLNRGQFWYNRNSWRVDATTGRAVFYLADSVSGLCAYRELLVEHYRKRVADVEAHGYNHHVGYEPGTRSSQKIDGRSASHWMSEQPNIDIRHGCNLTKSRWSPSEFRDKTTCEGWKESGLVEGWGITQGRFAAFLAEISQRGAGVAR